MDKSTVAVIPCCDYNDENVYNAVKSGINALGGTEAFVKPCESILIKPNFLSPAEPGTAVTTHPAVTGAVFRLLSEAGYRHLCYGDSPGHGTSRAAAQKSGTDVYAERYGVVPADMKTEVKSDFPQGRTAKSFYLCKAVAECDAIINVCKMKTHQLEKITGAVKNVYGFICGARKAAGHVSYSNANSFARMLCDLNRFKTPRLNIMDGITAMEGNGPGSGTPTAMNVLLISKDPVALDSVYCRLVHLDPKKVPTCLQGQLMGIGVFEEERIRVLLVKGISASEVSMDYIISEYGNPNFDVDRKGTKFNFLRGLSDIMTRFTKKPVIDESLCVRCGICVHHCPVPGKAVNFVPGEKDSPPKYDYKKCIRCYCCQEMCPEHAIHT